MGIAGKKGQNIIEYTLLILVVGAALTAMTVYIQRAMNSISGGGGGHFSSDHGGGKGGGGESGG